MNEKLIQPDDELKTIWHDYVSKCKNKLQYKGKLYEEEKFSKRKIDQFIEWGLAENSVEFQRKYEQSCREEFEEFKKVGLNSLLDVKQHFTFEILKEDKFEAWYKKIKVLTTAEHKSKYLSLLKAKLKQDLLNFNKIVRKKNKSLPSLYIPKDTEQIKRELFWDAFRQVSVLESYADAVLTKYGSGDSIQWIEKAKKIHIMPGEFYDEESIILEQLHSTPSSGRGVVARKNKTRSVCLRSKHSWLKK